MYVRFPISDQLQLWSSCTVSEIRWLYVENNHSHLAPSLEVTPIEFCDDPGLSIGEENVALFVLIQYQSVTDRQTDGRTFLLACYRAVNKISSTV